jgi:hypothetical protein
MKTQLNRPSIWLALGAVLLASSTFAAGDAKASDAAVDRGKAASKPADLTVELTIPTTSPHTCDLEKIQVTPSTLFVFCRLVNKHDGDKITRYAYSLRSPGAQVFLELILAAKAAKSPATIEFDTDTKKNIDGCAKKECRNILSLTW